MGKLYWSDRIRTTTVCKSWHQVPQHGIPHIDQLPWMKGYNVVVYSRNGYQSYYNTPFELFDTALKRSYRLGEISANISKGGAVLRDSRYVWVLFQPCPVSNRFYCLFLYSPFTNELIQLPNLELDPPVSFVDMNKVP